MKFKLVLLITAVVIFSAFNVWNKRRIKTQRLSEITQPASLKMQIEEVTKKIVKESVNIENQKPAKPDLKNQQDSSRVDWPRTQRTFELTEKVIMTPTEKSQLHDLLADTKLIHQHSEFLLSSTNEELRMKSVEFLIEALAWADNPAMKKLLSELDEVILTNNVDSVAGQRLKRSIAADKMELYAHLFEYAPSHAKWLEKQKMDERIRKITTFAYNFYVKK